MSANKWFIIFVLLFSSLLSQAQNFEQYFPKFYANGKELTLGASGGLRNPQFSNIDLDNDGIQDLFVFDRTGSKVLCFLNRSTKEELSYEYAPQYESSFPKLQTWALLHDYNKDGVEDIFTLPNLGLSGIQVWKGSRNSGKLSYSLVRLPYQNILGVPSSDDPQQLINLYHAITDIPAIIDVDNDGDTDVLTFDSDGGKVVYYNNLSKEKGYGSDTLIMETKDRCYGKIFESMFSSTLYFSADGIACATGNAVGEGGPRHSGSTVLAFDEGCDGDKDLILGDVSTSNIVFLRNTGSLQNPWITYQDIAYPPSKPLDLFIFNAAFLVDVNNDKVKDLIVVPNETDGGVNTNHIWLYLNEGSDCNPNFQLHTKQFLVDQMVSIGAKSNAGLIDINGDGLKDILISGNGLYNNGSKINKIFYFKNTGTKKLPEFTLADDNYFNFPSFTSFSVSLSITAGDADGDGDDDVMIGTGGGELYYYENKAGANKPASFGTYVYPYMDLFIGTDVKPHLYDVDGDGNKDLLAGEQNYSLNFYKNTAPKGSAPVYKTSPDTDDFGHIFKKQVYEVWNNSPFLTRDYNGNEIAVIGFQDGRVSQYLRKKTPNTDSLILVQERMGNIFAGEKSTPELYDFNGNGYFDLVVGNFRGGLSFYNTTIQSSDVNATTDLDAFEFLLYPNPANDKLTLKLSDNKIYSYTIVDIVGNVILQGKAENDKYIDVTKLTSGFYRILVKDNNNYTSSKPFVKI